MLIQENYFSCYILLTHPISLSYWLPLLLEMLGNMCIVILCFPVYEEKNFGINLSYFINLYLLTFLTFLIFSYQAVILNNEMCQGKNRTERVLSSLFLKGFH